MKEPTKSGVAGFLERFTATLKSSHLVMLLTALFVLDLVVPDPIFLIDEILLGLLTILVARWKGRPKADAGPPKATQSSKPPPKNVTPDPFSGQ